MTLLQSSLLLGAGFCVACVGDTPTPDGSAPDAATDGASDAPPVTFCTAHASAAFCEDFDRSPAPPWSFSIMSQALGAAAPNESAFTSPPRSVAFALAAATAPYQGSFLGAVVPTSSATGARLSLSVRFELLDTSPAGSLDFFILRTDGVGGLTIHRAIVSGTETWSFGPSFQAIDTPPLNQWLAVVFDVTFDGADAGADAGTGTAALTFNGKTYPAIPSSVKAPASTVGVLLGGQSTTATAAKVHYSIDDVVLELK